MKSYQHQRKVSQVLRYILLTFLAIVWIFPIIWIILTSFSVNNTGFVTSFIPRQWTINNYVGIFNTSQYPFAHWLVNTFVIAVICAVVNTFITIIMSYALSRLRFRLRKPFLQFALVLGMFPGFMSMIALYYILKAINLTNLAGLTLIYIGGAGLAFYIAKGFFDTIPRSIDEAAIIDGANKWQVFTKITLPLARPIIVYTSLTAFMAPWIDFIFPSIILGSGPSSQRTIAYGLSNMMTSTRGAGTAYFPMFVAGCVIIAIPITVLFIIMQKFYVNGITAGADKG
ncbi:sugar ABC transporter permease [Lactovum odontotermitis]